MNCVISSHGQTETLRLISVLIFPPKIRIRLTRFEIILIWGNTFFSLLHHQCVWVMKRAHTFFFSKSSVIIYHTVSLSIFKLSTNILMTIHQSVFNTAHTRLMLFTVWPVRGHPTLASSSTLSQPTQNLPNHSNTYNTPCLTCTDAILYVYLVGFPQQICVDSM